MLRVVNLLVNVLGVSDVSAPQVLVCTFQLSWTDQKAEIP